MPGCSSQTSSSAFLQQVDESVVCECVHEESTMFTSCARSPGEPPSHTHPQDVPLPSRQGAIPVLSREREKPRSCDGRNQITPRRLSVREGLPAQMAGNLLISGYGSSYARSSCRLTERFPAPSGGGFPTRSLRP